MNTEKFLDIARAVADTEPYLNGDLPDSVRESLPKGDFTQEVHVPQQKAKEMLEFLEDGDVLEELLDASWAIAVEAGALRFYEEKVIFPINIMRSDGTTPLEVSIRRGDPDRSYGRLWYIAFVNTYVRTSSLGVDVPSKAIERFAWMGPWESFLEDLEKVALPESWDFGEPQEGRRRGILKSYITNTFYRLETEGKVCISEDKDFAAFNSGLVDERFDDIYLCFEPQMGKVEWRFCGFAALGNRALKKRVAKCFNPLPQTASYFDKIEDLLFDPQKDLHVDHEHVLIDNVDRLPLSFLERELRDNDEVMDVVEQIKACAESDREDLYEQLSEIIETDSRVYRTLKNRLEDAIDIAKRRVKWNFKTAIPSYYPRANQMSLLLPLCLIDERVADAALVVQLQESGAYQGQTILTIEQAYTNARLICRPDSDWLTAQDECPRKHDCPLR